MNRRDFLASSGIIVSGSIAGCSSDTGNGNGSGNGNDAGNGNNQTTTTTQASEPTTAPPEGPQIEAVNLTYQWQKFGDAIDAAVEAATPGLVIPIAYRFSAYQESSGEIDLTQQVRVFGPDGNRVGINSTRDTQISDQGGRSTWENAMLFNTSSWQRGSYTADVVIQNNQTDRTSRAVETEFELTEPLRDQEVSVPEIDSPEEVRTGEPYQVRLLFANNSDRDGGFLSTFSVRTPQRDWQTFQSPIGAIIPSGGSNDWRSNTVTFSQTGEATFRIDRINYTWDLSVTE